MDRELFEELDCLRQYFKMGFQLLFDKDEKEGAIFMLGQAMREFETIMGTIDVEEENAVEAPKEQAE